MSQKPCQDLQMHSDGPKVESSCSVLCRECSFNSIVELSNGNEALLATFESSSSRDHLHLVVAANCELSVSSSSSTEDACDIYTCRVSKEDTSLLLRQIRDEKCCQIMTDSVDKSGEDALVFLLKSVERFSSLTVRCVLHQGAPNGGAISNGCDRYVSLTIRETFNGGMVSNVFSCNLHSVQSCRETSLCFTLCCNVSRNDQKWFWFSKLLASSLASERKLKDELNIETIKQKKELKRWEKLYKVMKKELKEGREDIYDRFAIYLNQKNEEIRELKKSLKEHESRLTSNTISKEVSAKIVKKSVATTKSFEVNKIEQASQLHDERNDLPLPNDDCIRMLATGQRFTRKHLIENSSDGPSKKKLQANTENGFHGISGPSQTVANASPTPNVGDINELTNNTSEVHM